MAREYKSCVLVANKSDLLDAKGQKKFEEEAREIERRSSGDHAPRSHAEIAPRSHAEIAPRSHRDLAEIARRAPLAARGGEGVSE